MKGIGNSLRTIKYILTAAALIAAFSVLVLVLTRTSSGIKSAAEVDPSEPKKQKDTLATLPYDTVLDEGIYRSYVSLTLKEPVFVSYVLYRGGGDCSRSKFKFKNDSGLPLSAARDYAHSGYDEGHLANAEDFAYDCEYDERTFRFYNCVPQRPQLNRGAWKHWETVARICSQNDSVLIVSGSVFGADRIGPDQIAVPVSCWKVTEALTTKKVLFAIYCGNESGVCDTIGIDDLSRKIGYQVPLRK
jgi:DNA/RNA endonuclease G (NUC1)